MSENPSPAAEPSERPKALIMSLVGIEGRVKTVIDNAMYLLDLENLRYSEAFTDETRANVHRALMDHFQQCFIEVLDPSLSGSKSREHPPTKVAVEKLRNPKTEPAAVEEYLIGVIMQFRRYLRSAGIPLVVIQIDPLLPKEVRADKILPYFGIGTMLRHFGASPRRTVGFVAVAGPEEITSLTRGFVFKVIPPDERREIEKCFGVQRMRYYREYLAGQAPQTGIGRAVRYPEGSIVAVDMPAVNFNRLRNPMPTIPDSPTRDLAEIVLLDTAASIEPEADAARNPDVANVFAVRWFPAESSRRVQKPKADGKAAEGAALPNDGDIDSAAAAIAAAEARFRGKL